MLKPNIDLRRTSQLYFVVFYLVAGFFFLKAVSLIPVIGAAATEYRFPAVEAFLPISALIGLKQWLSLGIYDAIHPAGLTILVVAMISAFLCKRGLCSHLCPVGTASELAYKGREKIVADRIQVHPFIHYPLMTMKYILLLFFIYVIFLSMPGPAAAAFIKSPYNTISDVKMLKFFLNPSTTTVIVVSCLVVLSLVVQNFWCRYLCPYGALLNLFAFFSPLTLARNQATCISCKKCDQVCPNGLKISTEDKVTSPECTLCQTCIKACPKPGTLTINSRFGGAPLRPFIYSALFLSLFFAGIGIAMASGHWNSAEILGQYWIKYLPMIDLLSH